MAIGFYSNNQTGSTGAVVSAAGQPISIFDNTQSIAGSTAAVGFQLVGSDSAITEYGNAPMLFLAPPTGLGVSNTFVAGGSGNATFVNNPGGGDKTVDAVDATSARVNGTTDTILNFITGDIFKIFGAVAPGNVLAAPDLTAPLTSSVLQVKLASGTAFNVNFNNVTFAKLQADVSAATVTPTVWQIAA
jgi:hypothetical protein